MGQMQAQRGNNANTVNSLEDILFFTIRTHGKQSRRDNHRKKHHRKNEIMDHRGSLLGRLWPSETHHRLDTAARISHFMI